MRLFWLALRNLSRNRRRTAITLSALLLGVAAIIIMRGFINGQEKMMVENLVDGQVGAIQVHKKGYLANVLSSPLTIDLEDSPALRSRIAAVPGVRAVAGRINFGAMVSTPDVGDRPGKTSFFMAQGLEPEQEQEVLPRRWSTLSQGRAFASSDERALILSADFARGVEATVAAEGAPIPPEEQWPAVLAADRDGTLNGEAVRLVGTAANIAPGDKKFGFVPLGVAQKLLRMEGRVTEYALAVDRLDNAPRVRDAVQAALGPQYEVHTWEQLLPFLKDLIKSSDVIFSIISTIFLVVVILGIVNAMLMSVLERVREIGTMLAVGMKRRQVVLLFLMEGSVLGLFGGSLGVLLGAAIVFWLHKIGIELPAPGATVASVLRPTVGPVFLLQTLLLSTAASSVAALWPAMRASALRPVEALAHL